MTETSPFRPGARVAISDRYGSGYREGHVHKVHKNGNFTLVGSSQQWRPWVPTSFDLTKGDWTARRTGSDPFSVTILKIWNAATDAEIQQARREARQRSRWSKLLHRLQTWDAIEMTEVMMDKIEAVLEPAATAGEPPPSCG